jgi:hypothetical protein
MNTLLEKERNFPALQVSYFVKDDHIKVAEMAGTRDTHDRDKNFITYKVLTTCYNT